MRRIVTVAGLLLAAPALAHEARAAPDRSAMKEAVGPGTPGDRYVPSRSIAHYLNALLARDAGDDAAALAELRLAALYDVQSPWPRYALAEEYARRGEPRRAETAAHDALELDPAHAPSLVLLGRLALGRDRAEDAVSFLGRASRADPRDTRAWALLVRAQLRRGDLEAAAAAVDRLDALAAAGTARPRGAARPQREAAQALVEVAEAFAGNEADARAETFFARAAEREPGDPQRLLQWAAFYESRARWRDAAALQGRAIAASGDDPVLAAAAARSYVKAGDVPAAAAYLDLVAGFDADPGRTCDALVSLAWELLSAGAPREALRALDLATRKAPGRPDPAYYAGAAWEALDEPAKAREAFARVPDDHPLGVSARVREAVMAARLGERAAAEERLRTLLQALPVAREARVALARLLEERGAFDEAVAVLEQQPDWWSDPALLVSAAELRQRAGRGAAALALLLDAAQIHPNDEAVAWALVLALDGAGRTQPARAHARRLLRRSPGHADALNFLAWSLTAVEPVPDEAEAFARRAVQLQPTSAAFLDTLGWVLTKRALLDEAQARLEQATALSDDPEIWLHLAIARRQAKRLEPARAAAVRSLETARAAARNALADEAKRLLDELAATGPETSATP